VMLERTEKWPGATLTAFLLPIIARTAYIS
jgi:hypothetical protein